MVRLTAELILTSPAFVNALKERELDLRGNKLSQIENLGATEDQYDVLDFSDNDITRLDGFPLLTRLSTLLFNNNRISTIASGLGPKIPNIETIILSNNRLENIADLDSLSELKKLLNLSLLRNPVTKQKHYRYYLIHKIPSLRVLDFHKIKTNERAEAAKLFTGESGAQLVSTLTQTRAIPVIPDSGTASSFTSTLAPEIKDKIKELLAGAQTMEEANRYDRILQTGKIPNSLRKVIFGENVDMEIHEEMQGNYGNDSEYSEQYNQTEGPGENGVGTDD